MTTGTIRRNALPDGGVIPPLVTPFTEDGGLDIDSMRRQARWLVDRGVDGVWLNGTTAEFPALSDAERTQVVGEIAMALQGTGCSVFAQVGAPATRLAAHLAEQAVAAGADAVSAVLPYYFAFDQEEIKSYLRAIRSAAGVPLYLYQVPAMTKVAASVPTLLELAAEGTLAGMKDSLGDVSLLRTLLERVKQAGVALPVFIGDAALLDTSILAGASGAITAVADVAPRHCKRLVAAALDGDWAQARQLESQLVAFLNALVLPSRPVGTPRMAALKFLQAEMGVIGSSRCADPFRQLDEAEQEHLRTKAMPLLEQLERSEMAAAHA